MHGITTETIGFYAAVYAVAWLACMARVIREPGRINWRNDISLACTAGFLSFGGACILVGGSPDSLSSPWYYLGFSALLGLLSKEQDKIAKAFLNKIMFAGRKFFEDKESEK